MEQIFISYAREDSIDKEKLFNSLVRKLNNRSFIIWDDSKIPPSKFSQTIKKEIDRSSVYILLVSKHFVDSKFISMELEWMLENLKSNNTKILIPVILKDFTKEEVSTKIPTISEYQYYPKNIENLSEHKSNETAWSQLTTDLTLDITRKDKFKKGLPKYFFQSLITFLLVFATVFYWQIGCEPSFSNECENIICYNNGNCVKGICICPDGYSGDSCEIKINKSLLDQEGSSIESQEDSNIGMKSHSNPDITTNPCANVICQNGGICNEKGNCVCKEGYTGKFCEKRITPQNLSIQGKLKKGYSPCDIIKGDINREDLYGKLYKGGMIFYLDCEAKFGFVASPQDQKYNNKYEIAWGTGCMNVDLKVPNFNGIDFTSVSALIGSGAKNTADIIKSPCINKSDAARVCSDEVLNGYNDWFLPSIGELQQMYLNIGFGASGKNHNVGGFKKELYYSSSESSEITRAYFLVFENGNIDDCNKNIPKRVRAIRKITF